MTLKEALDQFTHIIRLVQFASDNSTDDVVDQLKNFLILVGQAIVERDQAEEVLRDYTNRLWMTHVKGTVDCPACQTQFPVEFFVGTKGFLGVPLAATSREELVQKLEFPPLQKGDVSIPDYLPDTL